MLAGHRRHSHCNLHPTTATRVVPHLTRTAPMKHTGPCTATQRMLTTALQDLEFMQIFGKNPAENSKRPPKWPKLLGFQNGALDVKEIHSRVKYRHVSVPLFCIIRFQSLASVYAHFLSTTTLLRSDAILLSQRVLSLNLYSVPSLAVISGSVQQKVVQIMHLHSEDSCMVLYSFD